MKRFRKNCMFWEKALNVWSCDGAVVGTSAGNVAVTGAFNCIDACMRMRMQVNVR